MYVCWLPLFSFVSTHPTIDEPRTQSMSTNTDEKAGHLAIFFFFGPFPIYAPGVGAATMTFIDVDHVRLQSSGEQVADTSSSVDVMFRPLAQPSGSQQAMVTVSIGFVVVVVFW